MESRNQLGIYVRNDRATVVCLAGQGRENKLLGCFSVSLEGEERELGQQALADHIARLCSERGLKAATAVVALDCALFMQHAVHSDFDDFKKISATVRFDTEEALATDVSDMAVAFRITGTDQAGADLDVFTAQRSVLSDILLSLQSNGIDPVAVLPDVYCLSRYMNEGSGSAESDGAVWAVLSDARGYFVGSPNGDGAPMMRAFLVGPSQDRKALLSREALVTTALAGSSGESGRLCVFDASGTVDVQELSERFPFQVDSCDLAGLRGLAADDLTDSANPVDAAIAYGAALPESDKDRGVNFRNDHMPYLGKRVRLEKAVRFFSIALTVLLLALGVYAQTRLMRVNQRQAALRDTLEPDFLAVMPGVPELPSRMTAVVDRLERALRGVENQKGGHIDPKSLSAKMELVLKALNACAGPADLNLEAVTLTEQNITVNGNTSSRPNTLKVFDAMEKAGLTLHKTQFMQKGDRDAFNVGVQPKQLAP